jgi:hypothetical protein
LTCQELYAIVLEDHGDQPSLREVSITQANSLINSLKMKYGHVNLGQIEAIINKLGGSEGMEQFLAGNLTIKPVAKPQDFAVWQTIKIGTCKDKKSLLKTLEKEDLFHNFYPKNVVEKESFTVENTVREIDLVKISVEELCFKGANFEQVCACAKELGLEICPDETACQIALQFSKEMFEGEILTVISKPIDIRYQHDSTDYSYILEVLYSTDAFKKRISTIFAERTSGEKHNKGISVRGNGKLVFVKPRK